MVEYKAFIFNHPQHIERREDFEATDDEAALSHARQWVDAGALVEVWSDGFFVGIVRTKDEPKSGRRGPKVRPA